MPMDSNMVNGLRDLGFLFLGFALFSTFREEIKIILAVVAIINLAAYFLESPGIYAIARRRGIPHPWLAWIPLGKFWLKGCISDQYQYAARGKRTNRRWLVLILLLVEIAAAWGTLKSGDLQTVIIMAVLLPIPSVILHGIALYDLYASCDPDNRKLYFVLSILFGFTRPLFVLACRKKDGGMVCRHAEPLERQSGAEIPPWER